MSANSGVKRASKASKHVYFVNGHMLYVISNVHVLGASRGILPIYAGKMILRFQNEMPSQHESSPNDNNIQGKYANKAHTGIPSDYQNEPVNKSGSTYGEELSPKLDFSLVMIQPACCFRNNLYLCLRMLVRNSVL
ncbi:CRB_1a_G0054640.mRNA.1.CDS.1 [Saccharomyces cerevisiae]|nr:CRB_1a_G0054640.mRNA.1.CDS.1 [Saccharomyces cerevisiae]CAI7479470.1 CRB_1a_G0054640.mRNA.1.CDS.1 [Saccharomyces cerevisiae]